MPIASKRKKHKAKIYVISAPSGCGKTTLCEKLLKDMPRLSHSVSYTTRSPRKKEKDGVDYCFVSDGEFNAMVRKNKFVEHAKVFGRSYGTPVDPIKKTLKQNKDMLLSIDVQGAMRIKKLFGARSVLIFVLPPSLRTLRERLTKRHADTTAEINKRLKMAKSEIGFLHRYDYAVVNNKLKDALEQLKAIIKKGPN